MQGEVILRLVTFEMAGVISPKKFPNSSCDGFPQEVIEEFEQKD